MGVLKGRLVAAIVLILLGSEPIEVADTRLETGHYVAYLTVQTDDGTFWLFNDENVEDNPCLKYDPVSGMFVERFCEENTLAVSINTNGTVDTSDDSVKEIYIVE